MNVDLTPWVTLVQNGGLAPRMRSVRGIATRPAMERMLDKFTVDEGCWLWVSPSRGPKQQYGKILGDEAMDYAHRVSYKQFRGPIPEGQELDHLCRNGLCVRPSHLEPVTGAENKARESTGLCRRGLHELTSDNVLVSWDRRRSENKRECRWCRRARRHARIASRRLIEH